MKKLFLGLVIATLSMPVLAETNTSLEVLLGSAKQTTDFNDGTTSSDSDTSLGLRAAIAFHPNIAVEIGYHNFGETDDTYIDSWGDTLNDKVSTNAASLGLKGILPLNNQISVNARVGMSRWSLEAKETDTAFPGVVFEYEDKGTDFYYGIGAQFKLNENFSLGAEYTITPISVSDTALDIDHEIENFAISVGYSF